MAVHAVNPRCLGGGAAIHPTLKRTYVRMTSDGNPYARFRRALETGNETLVVAAARELPQVSLDDAVAQVQHRLNI